MLSVDSHPSKRHDELSVSKAVNRRQEIKTRGMIKKIDGQLGALGHGAGEK